jgi:hypothetical protein
LTKAHRLSPPFSRFPSICGQPRRGNKTGLTRKIKRTKSYLILHSRITLLGLNVNRKEEKNSGGAFRRT